MDQHKTNQLSEPTMLAPASLLPNVLERLARRQAYLSPTMPMQEQLAALEHPDWEIRAAAVHALGELGERDLLAPLQTALHDEHRLVRAAAVRALGKLGTHAPLDALLVAMRDPAEEVREMVVLVLGELSTQAPDPLKSLLLAARQDTHSNVREAATYALEQYAAQISSGEQERTVGMARHRGLQGEVLRRALTRYALIFKRQITLIHKSIWFCSPLLLLLWSMRYLLSIKWISTNDVSQGGFYLALFTAIASSAGTAFIYGGDHDAGFELTLATPTSTRIIMLFRFLLVIGYNSLLTASASAALAIVHGGGVWEIIHLWLGPMLLLSSLTLTISLLISSWLATAVTLVVEATQVLVFKLGNSLPTIEFSFSTLWQTQPPVLCTAALLLILALYLAPRQPRLAAL